ncbi:DUF1223-domain-containing protein [Gonapodya prolifera JEL478]|uniref:DUF1223-domain-containing protein n=1 Tax=Gonapodya prolifera (strain JEL478) TaxID=1344416 RepID=A0A139AVE2_GONPJ|nr:DUF1223-domain-containing protein [Gonapodya prolifera JEL478]|eukprot:KXS20687.1 DUF1223-domain-containing protein [Gonapodya prolifera JEL478]
MQRGSASKSARSDDTMVNSGQKRGFAVVELYTSQGCSSCPPAEKVLSNLIHHSPINPEEGDVFYLSYHVDYWNYLGWPDPHSHATYSSRQRHRSDFYRKRAVYTPMVCVNGDREDVVGSRGQDVVTLIKKEVRKKSSESSYDEVALSATVRLQGVTDRINNNGVVEIAIGVPPSFSRDQLSENLVVSVALTCNNITTHIQRGENRGLAITEDAIVVSFASCQMNNVVWKEEGEGYVGKVGLEISIPGAHLYDASLERFKGVVFVQEGGGNGRIVAAAEAQIIM